MNAREIHWSEIFHFENVVSRQVSRSRVGCETRIFRMELCIFGLPNAYIEMIESGVVLKSGG